MSAQKVIEVAGLAQPRKKGRPQGSHKCTKELTDRICHFIRIGSFFGPACVAAGISERTGHAWLSRGRRDEQLLESSSKAVLLDESFLHFLQSIRTAEATLEIEILAMWRKHCEKSAWACMKFLERRFPQRWGKHTTAPYREQRGMEACTGKSLHTILVEVAEEIRERDRRRYDRCGAHCPMFRQHDAEPL